MDCGGAWSELTDSSVIFWPTGALGPGPMGPPKRGPRAQGPIVARSMEIGVLPFAATQECAEGSRHDATAKMNWDSSGRPTAESSF